MPKECVKIEISIMKVLLLLPDAKMHKLSIAGHIRSMREAPLTLASLAAMAPEKLNMDFTVVDGSIDAIPVEDDFDLVGISVMTGTANAAYAIADRFRSRGIAVVLGGVHVTVMPDEACLHADSIVIGMAERVWPELLSDFVSGRLRKRYRDDRSQSGDWIKGLPAPRMDLIRTSGYMVAGSVQATRGCSKCCDFCSVPTVWKRFQKRPVADVVRDVKRLKGKLIAFGDVNLIDDVEYAKELFSALIPLKKIWGGLATTEVADDDELFELMVKSGCRYLLIGFESVNQSALNSIAKGFNRDSRYKELVRRLHKSHISVQGCFVFGFDDDRVDIFDDTVDRVTELKIDIPRYSIYTPYPGTRLFDRLVAEDRIVSFNWDDYDTMHVVYRPKMMTCTELYDGFKRAYGKTFKLKNIARRVASLNISCPINFAGNLAYRIFTKRLKTDPRFAMPHSCDPVSGNISKEGA